MPGCRTIFNKKRGLMSEDLAIQLAQLQKEINCQRSYRCVKEIMANYGLNKCHALSGTMSCLAECVSECVHRQPFANCYICKCPLRKFITLNFATISGNLYFDI